MQTGHLKLCFFGFLFFSFKHYHPNFSSKRYSKWHEFGGEHSQGMRKLKWHIKEVFNCEDGYKRGSNKTKTPKRWRKKCIHYYNDCIRDSANKTMKFVSDATTPPWVTCFKKRKRNFAMIKFQGCLSEHVIGLVKSGGCLLVSPATHNCRNRDIALTRELRETPQKLR